MLRRITPLLAAQALLATIVVAQSLEAGPVPRQVAAPPSDIESGLLRLPDPAAGAVRSRAALFELQWLPDGAGAWRAIADLPVKRGPLSLAVQAHGASAMPVALQVGGRGGLLG